LAPDRHQAIIVCSQLDRNYMLEEVQNSVPDMSLMSLCTVPTLAYNNLYKHISVYCRGTLTSNAREVLSEVANKAWVQSMEPGSLCAQQWMNAMPKGEMQSRTCSVL